VTAPHMQGTEIWRWLPWQRNDKTRRSNRRLRPGGNITVKNRMLVYFCSNPFIRAVVSCLFADLHAAEQAGNLPFAPFTASAVDGWMNAMRTMRTQRTLNCLAVLVSERFDPLVNKWDVMFLELHLA
jgi:hypothetical protein